nr:uncharacterized PE-PGRS family protein PE_PGRS54-like [Aegilops tauschii subsp. strangulata]
MQRHAEAGVVGVAGRGQGGRCGRRPWTSRRSASGRGEGTWCAGGVRVWNGVCAHAGRCRGHERVRETEGGEEEAEVHRGRREMAMERGEEAGDVATQGRTTARSGWGWRSGVGDVVQQRQRQGGVVEAALRAAVDGEGRAIACAGAGCGHGARSRGRTGLAPDAARGVDTGSQSAGQWGGGASRGGRGESRDGDRAAVPELVAEAGDGGRATASSGEARAWLDAKARGGGRGRRGGARSRREVRAEAVDVAAERERAQGGDVVRGRRARVERRVRARDDAAAVSACARQKEERRRLRLTGAVGKGQWSAGRKPGTSRRRGGRRRGPGGGGAPASAMWSSGVRGGAAWSRQRSGRRWTAKGVGGGAGFDPPFPI